MIFMNQDWKIFAIVALQEHPFQKYMEHFESQHASGHVEKPCLYC